MYISGNEKSNMLFDVLIDHKFELRHLYNICNYIHNQWCSYTGVHWGTGPTITSVAQPSVFQFISLCKTIDKLA